MGARPDQQTLAGVRVLDFTRGWAGPTAARLLGDLGAEVIKVEAPWMRGGRYVPREAAQHFGLYPDNDPGERPYNRDANYNGKNWNKLGVALSLDDPRGIEVLRELLLRSDILVENTAPRVLPRYGFSREGLLELNPRLIVISMPGFGLSGPSRDLLSFGPTLEATTGNSFTIGYPDSGPWVSGVAWCDGFAAIHGAAAALLALWVRRRTGRGQVVEVAQAEVMLTMMGDFFAAYSLDGSTPHPDGNRHPSYAPHGAYPCGGDDKWIALEVRDNAQWRALCRCIGEPEAAEEPRFAGALSRWRHREELDALVASWTRRFEHIDLMHRLQRAGVPAAAILDPREGVEDPHLNARGFFIEVDHPEAGRGIFPGMPVRLSKTPLRLDRPAPGLGQHNRQVLCGLLGLSPERYEELVADGVVADGPPDDERTKAARL